MNMLKYEHNATWFVRIHADINYDHIGADVNYDHIGADVNNDVDNYDGFPSTPDDSNVYAEGNYVQIEADVNNDYDMFPNTPRDSAEDAYGESSVKQHRSRRLISFVVCNYWIRVTRVAAVYRSGSYELREAGLEL